MKYIVSMFLTVLLLPVCVNALEISAQSGVLYEPVSGRVIFEKNKDEKRGMARGLQRCVDGFQAVFDVHECSSLKI